MPKDKDEEKSNILEFEEDSHKIENYLDSHPDAYERWKKYSPGKRFDKECILDIVSLFQTEDDGLTIDQIEELVYMFATTVSVMELVKQGSIKRVVVDGISYYSVVDKVKK